MQRIACALIGGALMLITALVALLLSDALAPGRVPPMLAFWGACGAGVLLVGGLAMLERAGAASGAARLSSSFLLGLSRLPFQKASWVRSAMVWKRWPICVVPAAFSRSTLTMSQFSMKRSRLFGYQDSPIPTISCRPP